MATLARFLRHPLGGVDHPPPPVTEAARQAHDSAHYRHTVIAPRLLDLQFRLEFLDIEAQQDVGFLRDGRNNAPHR